MNLEAIVFPAAGEVCLREFQLGPCRPSDIVVKTHYTMVSTGTELRAWGGHYGSEGKFPLILGYSVVGEVISLGVEAHGFRVGDLITGRNPLPVPGINSRWGGQASHHAYATSGEDRQKVVDAIHRGQIASTSFIDQLVSHRQAPQAYAALRNDKNKNFSFVFDWTQS